MVEMLLLLRYRGSIRLFPGPVKSPWGAFVNQVAKGCPKWGNLFEIVQNEYILWGIRKDGGRLGLCVLDWEYLATWICEGLALPMHGRG